MGADDGDGGRDAEGVREKYLIAIDEWRVNLARECLNRGIDRDVHRRRRRAGNGEA